MKKRHLRIVSNTPAPAAQGSSVGKTSVEDTQAVPWAFMGLLAVSALAHVAAQLAVGASLSTSLQSS